MSCSSRHYNQAMRKISWVDMRSPRAKINYDVKLHKTSTVDGRHGDYCNAGMSLSTIRSVVTWLHRQSSGGKKDNM